MLRIALAKGRLQEEFLKLIYGETGKSKNRSLFLKDENRDWEIILPKSSDVAKYLQMGMADVGIVGKDILEEEGIYFESPAQFDFGKCEMVIAGPKYQKKEIVNGIRVATKYPKIASKIFKDKGIYARIIYLQGSVELAVATGVADVIVDIVETGKTLRENGLTIYEKLFDVNAKLALLSDISEEKRGEIERLIVEIDRGMKKSNWRDKNEYI